MGCGKADPVNFRHLCDFPDELGKVPSVRQRLSVRIHVLPQKRHLPDATIGQSFHLAASNPYATSDEVNVGAGSGLEADASYVVLGARGSPGAGTTLGAKLQLDPAGPRIARAGIGGDYELAENTSVGGDYIYLSRAYGSWAGYLFGWSQLAIIRPGDIALMAFIFARYAQTLYAPFPRAGMLYAVAAVVVLTTMNVMGVQEGKWTQNLLTVARTGGLLLIGAAGLVGPGGQSGPGGAGTITLGGVKLALILVMFTFGGWNEMAYVSAEVKCPEKNIVRALALGTAAVTVLYLCVNGAYLSVLGAEGMAASPAVAVDTVKPLLPDLAARAVSVLICISALGAVNGLVFTCLLYTSDAADELLCVDLGGRRIIKTKKKNTQSTTYV